MPAMMISVCMQNKRCRGPETSLVWVGAWHNVPLGNLSSGIFLDVSSAVKLRSLDVGNRTHVCCEPHALCLVAACCKCSWQDCSWVWAATVPLGAGWWFGIGLPRLMDGSLAGAAAQRGLYFVPQNIFIFKEPLSSLHLPAPNGPGKSQRAFPTCPAVGDCWRSASCNSWSFCCHGWK